MANELLVKGAGLVARSEGVGKLAKSEALNKIGTGLGAGLGKMFQARNREFNRILANQLNKEGLSEEQKDELYDELEKKRGRYVYLNDRRLRSKAEQEVGGLADNTIEIETRKNNLAVSAQSTNGNMDSSLQDDTEFHIVNKENTEVKTKDGIKGVIISNSENMQSFSSAFAEARKNNKQEFTWNGKKYHTKTKEELESKNEKPVKKPIKQDSEKLDSEKDGDGTYSYESETETMNSSVAEWYNQWSKDQALLERGLGENEDDEEYNRRKKEIGIVDVNNLPEDLQFVTHEEFINMIDGYAPDENSESAFQGHIDKTIKDAENVQPGETPNFNWSVTYDKMKTFEAKGNSKAIWNNPILGGRVPKDDLINSIKSGTYSDYGIGMTEEDAKQLDPTKDTPITDDDARIIADEIINNQPELRSNLLAGYLTNLSSDIYNKSLNQDVLKGFSVVDSEILGTSQSQNIKDVEFMTEQEKQQKLQEIENQRLSINNQGDQGNQGNQPIFNPDKGINQFNIDNNNEKPKKNKDEGYNYSAVAPLSLEAKGGKANILENGQKITMQDVPVKKYGVTMNVDVKGVTAKGNSIVINTNIMDENFGEFKKQGNKYTWVGDEEYMALFRDNASKSQQKAFDEFIKIVENDPAYAEQLLKHIKSGSGTISAATLK